MMAGRRVENAPKYEKSNPSNRRYRRLFSNMSPTSNLLGWVVLEFLFIYCLLLTYLTKPNPNWQMELWSASPNLVGYGQVAEDTIPMKSA